MIFTKISNIQGHGDKKFIPRATKEFMRKISLVSTVASELYISFADAILAQQPSGLGFASKFAQSSYYPGALSLSRKEIAAVSKVLEDSSIHPENTRIRKSELKDEFQYDVLQGSVEVDDHPQELQGEGLGLIRIVRGDYSLELNQICGCLEEARKYAANPLQEKFILEYQHSFVTGDMESYKESQRTWVKDFQPSVETIFGFVEPYRDPFGVRAEFEGLAAIVDKEETKILTALVKDSAKFIKRLPWAQGSTENAGKGPFEKDFFEEPDFTSLHSESFSCACILC